MGMASVFESLSVAQMVAGALLLRITLAPCHDRSSKPRARSARFMVNRSFETCFQQPRMTSNCRQAHAPDTIACSLLEEEVQTEAVPMLAVADIQRNTVMTPLTWSSRTNCLLGAPTTLAVLAVAEGETTASADNCSTPKSVAWCGLRAQMIGGARRACYRRRGGGARQPAASAAATRFERRQMGTRIARQAHASLMPECAPRSFDSSRIGMKLQSGMQASSRAVSRLMADSRIASSASNEETIDVCTYSVMGASNSKT